MGPSVAVAAGAACAKACEMNTGRFLSMRGSGSPAKTCEL